jgi:hypothetical protein
MSSAVLVRLSELARSWHSPLISTGLSVTQVCPSCTVRNRGRGWKPLCQPPNQLNILSVLCTTGKSYAVVREISDPRPKQLSSMWTPFANPVWDSGRHWMLEVIWVDHTIFRLPPINFLRPVCLDWRPFPCPSLLLFSITLIDPWRHTHTHSADNQEQRGYCSYSTGSYGGWFIHGFTLGFMELQKRCICMHSYIHEGTVDTSYLLLYELHG